MKIKKIVLTGGPCAGKSCALARLPKDLAKEGYRPVVVPEAATMLLNSGFVIGEMGVVPFQRMLMETQMALEEIFSHGAEQMPKDAPVVLICDRGVIDGKAYMTDDDFARLLGEKGLTEGQVMADYDGVFYLETAALHYPSAYSTANNRTRSETADQAVAQDRRSRSVWETHPAFFTHPGTSSFEEKYQLLKENICRFLAKK